MELLKNGHLTDTALAMFKDCRLSDEQLVSLADHVADCALCAGRLAEFAEQTAAYETAPAGIGSAVIHKIELAREQRQKRFRTYCFKVAGCAAAALVLLVSGIIQLPKLTRSQDPKAAPTPQYQLAAPTPQPTTPGAQGNVFDSLGQYFDTLFGSEDPL